VQDELIEKIKNFIVDHEGGPFASMDHLLFYFRDLKIPPQKKENLCMIVMEVSHECG